MVDVVIAVHREAAPTSTGSTNITTTDLGGRTPKAVMAIVNYCDTDGTAEDGMAYSFGFADSSVQGCAGGNDEHGVTTINSGRRTSTSNLIYLQYPQTTNIVVGAVTAFIADGVTINFTTVEAFTPSFITYVFFAGSDLSADVGNLDLGTGTSAIDVTAPGFEPDLVLGVSSCRGPGADRSSAIFSFGMAANDGSDTQRSFGWRNNDGGTTVAGFSEVDTSNIFHQDETGTAPLASIGTFDSSGFSVTPTASTISSNLVYLALNLGGLGFWVGSVDAPTSTGDWSQTGLSFQPQFVGLFLTLLDAEDSRDGSSKGSMGFSAFDILGNEFCNSFSLEDAATTTNTQSLSDNQAINFPLDDGSAAFAASYSSMDANGWTLNFTAANGTARKWFGLAIGAAAVGGGVSIDDLFTAFLLSDFDPEVNSGVAVGDLFDTFVLSSFDPTVNTGVNIVDDFSTFNLTGFIPLLATGVSIPDLFNSFTFTGFTPVVTITSPIFDLFTAFTFSTFIDTLTTGVGIASLFKQFNLIDYNPTVFADEGLIRVTADGDIRITADGHIRIVQIASLSIADLFSQFNLASFIPGINQAVSYDSRVTADSDVRITADGDIRVIKSLTSSIFVPFSTFDLDSFVPIVGTSVDVQEPSSTFVFSKFTDSVNIGVFVTCPFESFGILFYDPVVETGVTINSLLKEFTLTAFVPAVSLGVSVDEPLTNFTFSEFIPVITVPGMGATVQSLFNAFHSALFIPGIGTGVGIIDELTGFTYTGFDPTLEVDPSLHVRPPLTRFDLNAFNPIMHAVGPLIFDSSNLDLTPPFADISQIRYLIKNFSLLRDLLATGPTTQFTTADGKTILVRNGIIVDSY